MSLYPRDKLLDLLHTRLDLTLEESLQALDFPIGLLDNQLNPEDFKVVGHRIGMLGGRQTGGAGVFNYVGIQTQPVRLVSSLIIVQAAIVSLATAGVLRMATQNVLFASAALSRTRDGQAAGTLAADTGAAISIDDANAAELGTAVAQLDVLASTPVYFGGGDRDPVCVLFTGPRGDVSQGVSWNSRTVIISIGCHIRYREFDLAAR